MGASITEVLGGLDAWSIDFDWSPDLADELVEGSVLQVRKDDRLVYAGVILTPKPLKEGITVAGQSIEWWLGGDEGPLIESREYVAGSNKLPNGDFELGALYWKTREGSEWAVGVVPPTAPHGGTLAAWVTTDGDGKDDILEVARSFDVAEGQTYELVLWAHRPTGTLGRLRLRALFTGHFATPNLLTNGDLEAWGGVGWSTATDLAIVDDPANAYQGTKVIKATPSTRPDSMVNGDLEAGSTGWTGGTDIAVVTDAPNARNGTHVLKAGPNAQPQALTNGDFETLDLTGWTLAGNSYLSPVSNVINDSTRARNGNGVLLMGTVKRRAVANGDFETGDLSDWTDSPGTGEWSVNNVDRSGNYAAQLDGSLVASDAALVAQVPSEQPTVPSGGAGPHHHIATAPGEHWQFLGYAMKDPGSPPSGAFEAWAELQFYPDDTTVTTFTVIQSHHVTDLDPVGSWRTLLVDARTPAGDFTNMVVTLQISTPTSGLCHFDDIECVRIEGNEETLTSDAMTVAAGEVWELVVNARSGDAFRSGGLFPRVTLSGAGQPDLVEELNPISQTGGHWFTTRRKVSIPEGYDTAVVTLRARDIEGEWIYVDDVTFTRVGGNVDTITADAITVIAGDEYELDFWARSGAAFTDTGGALNPRLTVSGPGKPDVVIDLAPVGQTNDTWTLNTQGLAIAEGYDSVVLSLEATDITGDAIYVDDITFIRTKGNIDSIAADTLTLVPERSYKLTTAIKPGDNLAGGEVKVSVLLTAPGRPDKVLEAQPQPTTKDAGGYRLVDLDVTPPSGYDTAVVSVVATDIVGDNVYVDDLSLVDQDESTLAIDWPLPSMPASWTQFTLGTDVFVGTGGTEQITFQIVAEGHSAGWVVDDCSLRRTDAGPTTVAEVVESLLTHPSTGQPIFVTDTIDGADDILYDWTITNAYVQPMLQHLLTGGVCAPTREYRVYPDGTLSIGEADDLYDDRRDIVLTDVPDLVVVTPPDVTPDHSRRVTEVKVIGAQVPAAGGDTVTITATAQVPGVMPVDYQGHSLVRTKLVQESAVDHPAFASAYAQFLAEREADNAQAITVDVSDTSGLGLPFRAGDWIYVYKPDAGIEDTANEMTVDGRIVFPLKQRLMQAEWSLGPGYSLEVRRPDGSIFDIEDQMVRWNPTTSARLTLGALRRDFVVDDQGPAAYRQFVNFRAFAAK